MQLSQPKVFEFAKEVGMETLTLMDKIRGWNLPVKSHMAELTPEMMDAIKTKLAEESGPAKKSTSTKTVRKKSAEPKAAVAKNSSSAEAAPAAKKKAAVKKTKPKEKEEESKDSAVEAKGSKTVIRRKKVEEVAAEEIAETEVDEVVEEKTELKESPVEPQVAAAVTTPPVAEKTPIVHEPAETTEAAPPVAAVAAAKPAEKVAAPMVARKREIPMTDGGPVSGISSPAPRRNIVGKIDLSKMEQHRSPGGNSMRPQKTVNRNLRTGFIAETRPDFNTFVDIPEFDDGRKDKKKKLSPVAAAPATGFGAKEKDLEEPPAFVSSDFKKREVVFQPKKKKTMIGLGKKTQITVPKASKRIVKVHGSIKVADLAQAMGIKAPELIKVLINNGVMATINTDIDFDTVSLVVPEFKFEAVNELKSDTELLQVAAFGELEAEKISRSPVVTVMGHVDHGKTTLLDGIRKTRVAAGEAGGITQHIGAYRVKTSLGEVTFIDTPGHAAFTAMRARGANVTDIVILVVAADDGVMPQTIEAINHAKSAKVPIVVAVNKIDKPGANPDKIKQQLSEYELIPEEWGGTTIFCPVSALNGTGIDELLEQLSVLAEVLELKGNPKRSATGVVIESRLDKGKGNVATLLIQDGTLSVGQYVVVGTMYTKVRQLLDDKGKPTKEAGPGMPVEIIGLPECPAAGDRLDGCVDEKSAQEVAQARKDAIHKEKQKSTAPTLDEIFAKAKAGDLKELAIVLKADVAGSVEAIKGMFAKLGNDEVKLKVLHSAVGGITESDVLLVSTTGGIVVGFNVRPDTGAQRLAKERAVEIRTYSIVYELIDDMKLAMQGMLDPNIVEKVLGRVAVRNTFTVPKIGTIAGCFVTDGKVTRNSSLRLIRDGKIVFQGKLSSLKRFKDDAKEVATGFECGIGIENYNDIKVGDEIEAYVQESVLREL